MLHLHNKKNDGDGWMWKLWVFSKKCLCCAIYFNLSFQSSFSMLHLHNKKNDGDGWRWWKLWVFSKKCSCCVEILRGNSTFHKNTQWYALGQRQFSVFVQSHNPHAICLTKTRMRSIDTKRARDIVNYNKWGGCTAKRDLLYFLANFASCFLCG